MHGFQSDKITNINYNKNNYNKNTIKIKDLKRLIKDVSLGEVERCCMTADTDTVTSLLVTRQLLG